MKPDAESQIRREELAFRQGAKAFTQGRTENPSPVRNQSSKTISVVCGCTSK